MPTTSDVATRVYDEFVSQLKDSDVEQSVADGLRDLLKSDKPPKAEELVSYYQEHTERGDA